MQNLSPTQREILLALVDLYTKKKKMIKSKEVADVINKDEGTVRNIILSLKVLGLIDSKPGPNGGYMPTLKAYEVIKNPVITPMLDKLSLYKGMMETDIKINHIEILDITNPMANKVLLDVEGDLRKLKVGDPVRLGPTPYSRLVIEGIVLHSDEESREIIIDVKRMISIPKEKVKNLISKKLVVLRPYFTLKEASINLYKEGIRGAPVLGEKEEILGILTTADIIKAFFEGNFEAKVSDYMKRQVITISSEDDVLDAIKKMIIYNVGRLIVLDSDGRAVGIVTRTDILKAIAGLEGLWVP
ncbi:CBS domain-containing protein [Sulfuracidifex metallicus]|jgi:predicted transcriptional regulator|uniref:CBS domain-containing protein n=1 Tax=Sulfuracidifex metallicus DSM 6482 = JCM 9184 TaxID=523847 RepID=A0A6A9QM22_SULME|nr:CBS domain-containing protein [Sulfuracidifex metallicus]MCY0850193.1 CBS domain-containing protein [Sulfuracidifex metallicus]MUN28758.1 CBS domain-containing protein [Sulfuracidifex metallicus DSM 6482 = JCM 9184]WOE50725.1 CBS domain-containing protein [Sulfuracidifex metallicus DSM 6482 = JCM 9184]